MDSRAEVLSFLRKWDVKEVYTALDGNWYRAGKPFKVVLVSDMFIDQNNRNTAAVEYYFLMESDECTAEDMTLLANEGEVVYCVDRFNSDVVADKFVKQDIE